ncbi:hypothetical protein [Haloarchaeobius sp. HRN-SO-5]
MTLDRPRDEGVAGVPRANEVSERDYATPANEVSERDYATPANERSE